MVTDEPSTEIAPAPTDLDRETRGLIAEQVGTSQVHVGRLIAASLTSLRELLEEPEA